MASRKTSYQNVPTIKDYSERRKNSPSSDLKEGLRLLENIKSISDINKIIGIMYDLKPDESETTIVLRKLRGFGLVASDWDVIHSSSNNFDCLIHSFLTATCDNFRRLVQDDKDEFANFFRRAIFLKLPVVLCYKEYEPDIYNRIENTIHRRAYLEEMVLFLLAAQFKFQVLAASSSTAFEKQLQLIDSGSLKIVLPSPCCEWRDNNNSILDWPLYCIYTNGEHFESVRVDGKYEISEKQAVYAMTSLEDGPAYNITSSEDRDKNSNNSNNSNNLNNSNNSNNLNNSNISNKSNKSNKSCTRCTFKNPGNLNACQMCNEKLRIPTRRRGSNTPGVKTRSATKKNMNKAAILNKIKACRQCTFNNPGNSEKCEACNSKLGGGTRRRRRGRATRRR